MPTITELVRQIPIAHECDVCVIGGSTAAWLALDGNMDVADVDAQRLRAELGRHGAIML